jgi:hypothetical protein
MFCCAIGFGRKCACRGFEAWPLKCVLIDAAEHISKASAKASGCKFLKLAAHQLEASLNNAAYKKFSPFRVW